MDQHQLPLPLPEHMRFDGRTLDSAKDTARLSEQMRRVFKLMCDGQWRTLGQISNLTHAPEASISARLRDLRKPRFGGHTVLRRRYGEHGLHQYKLIPKE